MNSEKKIKGYKGFNPDLTCRDFKYEVGKEYETDEAKTCETGFHFCENPFDVWGYYPPCGEDGRLNRFCEVEGSGDIDNSHSDKIACSHINVIAEIGLQGIINAGVKFIMYKVSRSGSKQSNTGNNAHSATTGYNAHSATTGNYAHSATTGNYAHSVTTGYCAHSVTTGYCAQSAVKGHGAIAVSLGMDSVAKGNLGCWIVLAEYDNGNGNAYPIKCVKAFKVDGEKIKSDTFYKLVNGEAVEVKE